MNKFKILSLAMVILSVNFITFAQDFSDPRWNQSPSTKLYTTGSYSLPRAENIVQRDMSTRLYHTAMGDFLVPPNIRPYPSTATQSEERLVTMYGNQNVMYGAWNSYYPSFYGTGFCFTSNGGTSWIGNYQMIVSGNNGDPGPWVWSSGSTWPGRLGISVIGSAGISCTYSTDNGTTWTPFVNAGGSSTDKNLSCVDETTGSPFLGRAYTVWTDFGGTNVNRIVGAYTSNGGVSWTGYQPVSPVPPSGHHMQGCDVRVGPGGVVYVVWATCTTNGQNSTEDYLGFAKSTNGGVNWSVSNYNVVDVNGIRAQYYYNNFRVNGFPILAVDHSGGARNGWIYAVLAEKLVAPARDNGDACMCRSTDGGTTWTHTLINGDASGNYQWFPSVNVDQSNGNVAVGYYDTRGLTAPNAQYYVSWSNNGGNSWVDVQASDHTFIPTPISGLATGYQGDYTGITFSNSKIWPFWCDPSSSIYQVWTVGITTVQLTHDIQMGPFLNLPPSPLIINTPYTIKGKITNVGSSNENGVQARFFINGILTNTSTFTTLNVGQSDSASNVWTPTSAGTYILKYVSVLGTDTNKTNDTLQTSVTVLSSIPSLCEGFTGTTFPPTNWTNSSTYWTRATVSAYGVGSGSAMWDNYSAPTGTRGQLRTLTFPATVGVDSIHFAVAYCYWSSYPTDSLIIQTSTNGGTTWVSLVRLSATQLNTVTSCTHPWTPTAASWGRRAYALPIGTNKITFEAYSGFGDGLYIDSIGTNACWNYLGIANNNNELPKVYSLSQNYPNPFNPETQIMFALPKAGQVKLVVYDVLGAEVTTLINENKPAGNYNVTFNGSNLASGVYFYKITAGTFTQVKKMLILK